jgi:hypothetical protein
VLGAAARGPDQLFGHIFSVMTHVRRPERCA